MNERKCDEERLAPAHRRVLTEKLLGEWENDDPC